MTSNTIFAFVFTIGLAYCMGGYYQPSRGSSVWGYFTPPLLHRVPKPIYKTPMDAMVDLTNDLGVAILQDHSFSRGNFAFSPYGVASVLVVLYEGARGESAWQIHRAVRFPFDKDVIRVGFRDIHRHLRSYFSHEGYLSGITLNKGSSSLKPEYKKILRFYGYDVDMNQPLDEENQMNITSTTAQLNLETGTMSSVSSTLQATESSTQSTPTVDVTESDAEKNKTKPGLIEEKNKTTEVISTTIVGQNGETTSSLLSEESSTKVTEFPKDELHVTSTTIKEQEPTTESTVLRETTSEKKEPGEEEMGVTKEEPSTSLEMSTSGNFQKETETKEVEANQTTNGSALDNGMLIPQLNDLEKPSELPPKEMITKESVETNFESTNVEITSPFTTIAMESLTGITIENTMTISEEDTLKTTTEDISESTVSSITENAKDAAMKTAMGITADITSEAVMENTSETTMDSTAENITNTTVENIEEFEKTTTGSTSKNTMKGTMETTQEMTMENITTATMEYIEEFEKTTVGSTPKTAVTGAMKPTPEVMMENITNTTVQNIEEFKKTTAGRTPKTAMKNTMETTADTTVQNIEELEKTTAGTTPETAMKSMMETTPKVTMENTTDITVQSAEEFEKTTTGSTFKNTMKSTMETTPEVTMESITTTTVENIEESEKTTTEGTSKTAMETTTKVTMANTTNTTVKNIEESEKTTTGSIPKNTIKGTMETTPEATMENTTDTTSVTETPTKSPVEITTETETVDTAETTTVATPEITTGSETQSFHVKRKRDVSSENFLTSNMLRTRSEIKIGEPFVRSDKVLNSLNKAVDSKTILWMTQTSNKTFLRTKRTITDYLKTPANPDLSLQLQNGMFDTHVSRNSDLYRSLPRLLFLVDGAIDTPVPMMTYTNVFPYGYIPRLHAKALEFPLDDVRYKLLILLPVERRGLRQLIYDLTDCPLREVLNSLRPARVRTTVPTFMVEGFVILTSTLQKLGIWDVFDPRKSNLSGMSTDPELYVRNIEQSVTVVIRNYVEILDIQTRTMAARNMDHEFEASHPFLYFVMDTATNVVLMAGQMLDPLNSRIY